MTATLVAGVVLIVVAAALLLAGVAQLRARRGRVNAELRRVLGPRPEGRWGRTTDGGLWAVLCGRCSTLGGHSADCPRGWWS